MDYSISDSVGVVGGVVVFHVGEVLGRDEVFGVVEDEFGGNEDS